MLSLLLNHHHFVFIIFTHKGYANFGFNRCSIYIERCFQFLKKFKWSKSLSSNSYHPIGHTASKIWIFLHGYELFCMNYFGLVCAVSSWLRVSSMVAGSFGWVVTDGFGWLQMVSGGFGWFWVVWVVSCFSSSEKMVPYFFC